MLMNLVDKITQVALGAVDAGACVAEHGCCCGTDFPRLITNCDGSCTHVAACETGGRCDI